MFPPVGCSDQRRNGFNYSTTAAADAGIAAVVAWFAAGNDPTGQIKSVAWVIRKDSVNQGS